MTASIFCQQRNAQIGRDAVKQVSSYLYNPSGGIIAQFESGAGANPETALIIFDERERISNGTNKQQQST